MCSGERLIVREPEKARDVFGAGGGTGQGGAGWGFGGAQKMISVDNFLNLGGMRCIF
jgi:hypothetical protein